MSIVQDLYTIFDKERARFEAKKSSKNAVLRELAGNLAFLHEGMKENLPVSKIIAGLEDAQYIRANDAGFDFDAIGKGALSRSTYGGVREFDKYRGWSTGRLIRKAYERLATLRKLSASGASASNAQLQSLFKFLMVIMAHIDGTSLRIKPRAM